MTEERVLAKVRALLAKAESTAFDAEAEALTAKAQTLMTRHALTRAMVDADRRECGEVGRLDVVLEPPYVSAKSFLVGAVATANRCQAVWSQHPPRAAVFGFPGDLEAFELLYTSLLLQAASSMQRAGPVRDAEGRSRTRSFRRAFLLGFASRIQERLLDAATSVADEVESESGTSLLPVLAARDDLVAEALRGEFPRTQRRRPVRVGNGAGLHAGREAGDRATLRVPDRVPDGSAGHGSRTLAP